ncbi:MAG TPA: hypothetical protein DET40_04045 [Lentisphaeria bacterium]|nr:MAG: hypothetical protein A2X45_01895 [Lentisphaerae bacterium GWF2_50_93]HCE42698.1 hypothetical protein [Lentisphaeria bacterium]
MNENNDSTELKLRDAPPKPIGLKKMEEEPELKMKDSVPVRPEPLAKTEKSLPLLVVRKEAPTIEPEVPEEKPLEEERVNKLQVLIALVAVAAIIVAGYFIFKNLSGDAPAKPAVAKAAAKAAAPAQNAKTKTDASKNQKKTDKAPAQKAADPKKDAKKTIKIDANAASKEDIVKTFAELKVAQEDAFKMADEIIAGRPYKSFDDLKNKYKDDKNAAGIIGKAFNAFGNKPPKPAAPKTDKNAKPAAAKTPAPAKTGETEPAKKEEAAPQKPADPEPAKTAPDAEQAPEAQK